MLIQNEYCNGGSLQDAIDNNRESGTSFPESEIKRILLHLCEGLRYVSLLLSLYIRLINRFQVYAFTQIGSHGYQTRKHIHKSRIADSSFKLPIR